MEGLERKAGVAKFHAGMATALRSGETESTARCLEMEVKMERPDGWEEGLKKKMNLVTKIKLNFISQFSTKTQSHQTYVTLHLLSLSLAFFGYS